MIRFDFPEGRFNHRSVGVLIHEEHVLLHRLVQDSYWSLPGGRVEMLEPTSETVVREFAEELGVEVRVDRLLWVMENFFQHSGMPYHELAFYYKVDLTDETHELLQDKARIYPGIEDDVELIYQWFPIAQLEGERFFPSFLRTALQELPLTTQHVVHRDREETGA